uniref:Putative secreted protein n=1 Tax=Ixodes ricinus TaxID=34613 RepID=A0A6B0UZ08_IXORI
MHVHAQCVVPVNALVLAAAHGVARGAGFAAAAVHQLVGRPLERQPLGALVQRQVAPHRLQVLAGLDEDVVLAVEQRAARILVQGLDVVSGHQRHHPVALLRRTARGLQVPPVLQSQRPSRRRRRGGSVSGRRESAGQSVPLHQLVGRRVRPEVVLCLHLGVVQRAGTHE